MTKVLQERLMLLTRPTWTAQDIISYFDQVQSRSTAYRIKDKAIELYGGRTTLGKQYVKRDSVMQVFGTTTENELKNLKVLLGNEEELSKRSV